MEYRVKHKAGFYVWVLDSGRVFRDTSGAIIRRAGVIIDISARKKVAESLSRQTNLMSCRLSRFLSGTRKKALSTGTGALNSSMALRGRGIGPEQP